MTINWTSLGVAGIIATAIVVPSYLNIWNGEANADVVERGPEFVRLHQRDDRFSLRVMRVTDEETGCVYYVHRNTRGATGLTIAYRSDGRPDCPDLSDEGSG